MTERELQQLIIEYCQLRHYLCYHTHDSRRSEPGFPDLVIVGQKGVLWRELKTAKGRLTGEQKIWIEVLNLAGQDAGVWRPADWPHNVRLEIDLLGRPEAPNLSDDWMAFRYRTQGTHAVTQEQARRILRQRATRRNAGATNVPFLT